MRKHRALVDIIRPNLTILQYKHWRRWCENIPFYELAIQTGFGKGYRDKLITPRNMEYRLQEKALRPRQGWVQKYDQEVGVAFKALDENLRELIQTLPDIYQAMDIRVEELTYLLFKYLIKCLTSSIVGKWKI